MLEKNKNNNKNHQTTQNPGKIKNQKAMNTFNLSVP